MDQFDSAEDIRSMGLSKATGIVHYLTIGSDQTKKEELQAAVKRVPELARVVWNSKAIIPPKSKVCNLGIAVCTIKATVPATLQNGNIQPTPARDLEVITFMDIKRHAEWNKKFINNSIIKVEGSDYCFSVRTENLCQIHRILSVLPKVDHLPL